MGKSVSLMSQGYQEINAGVVFAMGMISFSPLYWQYSISAEVFAMNNLFAAAIIYLVLSFSSKQQLSTAVLGAFICGLALCNQHTIVLFEAPLILWMLVLLWKRNTKTPSLLLLLALAFCMGLLPYMYLPYIATTRPKQGSWGDLATWQGFLHHFLRRDYGTFQLFSGEGGKDSEPWIPRTLAYFQDLHYAQGLQIIVPTAVIGAVYSFMHAFTQRTLVGWSPLVLVFTWAFYLAVFHSLSNLPLSNPLLYGVHQRFWLQPSIIVFVFAGVGVNAFSSLLLLLTSARTNQLHENTMHKTVSAIVIRIAVLSAVAFSVLSQFTSNYSNSNQASNMYFSNYAKVLYLTTIIHPLD
jgi:hypothetical protein